MAFSASVPSDVRAGSSLRDSKLSFVRINGKPNKLSFATSSRKRRGRDPGLKVTKAVLDNRNPSIGSNESSEPARILLERLFAQTQKLEEHMSQDSRLSSDFQLSLNLETLEADLMAALEALRKKEEEFQDAEKTVDLENGELRRAKIELERREREVFEARQRYRKIEEELKLTNRDLDSRAREIEGLKARLGEMDENVGSAKSALALKEVEIERVSGELLKKSEEAERIDSKLKSKDQLLNQANEVVKGQETEIQSLRKAIEEKEDELEAELALRRVEEAKLKAAEAKLEKETSDWLQVREEMKKFAGEIGKHANATMEDYERVKKLLGDARSELVSSQKSLSLSRRKMEEQERAVGNRLADLEEQKKNVMSYMVSLEDANKEIENERAKLRLAEARNCKLEIELSKERKSVINLDSQLRKERSALQKAVFEVSSFKKQLGQKSAEFEKTQSLLRVKESELVEAKLEIQRLKSAQAKLERVLEEKDLEIVDAKMKLDLLSNEISELRTLLNGKETQLIQATRLLKEKDEQLGIVQNELDNTKQKAFEAENVVERIVELTNKLVLTIQEEPIEESSEDIVLQKIQLESELEMTKERLRRKEMDVLIAQSSLAVKDEELKVILERSNEKERELKKMKDEVERDAADLRKLYALAQERMGEKTVGDLAIEKLQIEAAQLEAEAAMSALQRLSETSRELLNGAASSAADIDGGFSVSPGEKSDFWNNLFEENKESFEVVKTEVFKLSALTEELLKDAGIASLGANRKPVTT